MDAEELRRAHAAADAAYEPFASITDWRQEPVALGSWDDAASHLASVREAAPVEDVRVALDEVLRAAAVDTGAIEGLYPTDRGFTMSVARNVISLDQAEVEAGSGFRGSFEAQVAGFEHAVRLATEDRPLTEADVRELHEITCADQQTYRVWTEQGLQDRDFVKGTYKTDPNHVQLGDGSWHAYAPVDRVPDEMHRLVADVASYAFSSSPAVVRAAFVHHAFTSIHPFPDGNGRVARLLASIPLLRAASIPLWVEASDKDVYLAALRAADTSDRQPFLHLVTSLSLRLMRELALALRPPARLEYSSAGGRAAGAAHRVMEELVIEESIPHEVIEGRMPPLPSRYLSIQTGFGFRQRSGLAERAVVAVVDTAGEPWSEAVVLVLDRIQNGNVIERHPFGSEELVPDPTPAARRRLRALLHAVQGDLVRG